MFDTSVTVVGNLVDDPVSRRTSDGTPVVSFRIASSSRRWDKRTNEWRDGDTLFLKVSCWRQMGTRALGSLHRGDPVVVVGRLYTRSYLVGEQRRQSYELEANAIGPNMARVDVRVARRDATVRTYEVVEQSHGGEAGQSLGSGSAERFDPDAVADPAQRTWPSALVSSAEGPDGTPMTDDEYDEHELDEGAFDHDDLTVGAA